MNKMDEAHDIFEALGDWLNRLHHALEEENEQGVEHCFSEIRGLADQSEFIGKTYCEDCDKEMDDGEELHCLHGDLYCEDCWHHHLDECVCCNTYPDMRTWIEHAYGCPLCEPILHERLYSKEE